jgi:DinB superfamily
MSIQAVLKSQYHASLAMLRDAIDACPAELWTDASYVNPFWQVAYHTLFYTHFYLQPSESAFVPWEHHRPKHNFFVSRWDATNSATHYSIDEMRAYCKLCDAMIDSAVDRLDLNAPDSGFPWYKMSKLEHQFVNLRHIQHHTGQLAERIRQATGRGVEWVGGTKDLPA